MDDPDAKPSRNGFERMFDRPLTQPPEGEDGIGPTLGQDLGVEREREEDARHGAHPTDEQEADHG